MYLLKCSQLIFNLKGDVIGQCNLWADPKSSEYKPRCAYHTSYPSANQMPEFEKPSTAIASSAVTMSIASGAVTMKKRRK